MPIYERPTKELMADWAETHLTAGQIFERSAPVGWFRENYPKIKSNTVSLHVGGMAVNNWNRRHHPNIKPGSGHDLFFKVGPNQFRLWDPANDPAPLYKDDIERLVSTGATTDVGENDATEDGDLAEEAGREFAFERDLRNYLVRNLFLIEPGLHLYDEEGITGVEFPAGGRFIDILAVDKDGAFVVTELKVSRGYDRVIGQLLRYIGWVEANMEPTKPVRGLIVAREITEDLKLACKRLRDVQLIEYEISFKLRPVNVERDAK